MHAPLYDVVHGLALDIANASAAKNNELAVDAYDSLKELCESQENSELNHPLQWEALGDFSENHKDALKAYEKGLVSAEMLGLSEYSASIKFAIAESFLEQQSLSEAKKFATEASAEANKTNDNELKTAINEFLIEIERT